MPHASEKQPHNVSTLLFWYGYCYMYTFICSSQSKDIFTILTFLRDILIFNNYFQKSTAKHRIFLKSVKTILFKNLLFNKKLVTYKIMAITTLKLMNISYI